MLTTDEIAAQLIEALRTDAATSKAGLIDATSRGLEADAQWSAHHGAAAQAAVRIALDGKDPLSGPFGGPILGLAEFVVAGQTGDLERLLDSRPPRVSSVGDDIRVGLLTPLNDVAEFNRALLGRAPARPRYRAEPVRVHAGLGTKIDAQELAEYLGLTAREAADLYHERPTPAQVTRILAALVARARADAPLLGEILASVARVDLQALGDLPFVLVLLAVLRGVRPPGRRASVNLVQIVELGNGIEVALVIAPPLVRRDENLRRGLAAHLRHVGHRRVAPWMQWGERRKRREAFNLYVRRIAGVRPGVRALAADLRARHPEEYRAESGAVTINRLERISAALRPAIISRAARRNALVVRSATVTPESRFDRRPA